MNPVRHAHPEFGARPSAWKIALQVLGFLIGLALLAWCVSQALSPMNREQLAKLRDAPWTLVAGLFLTSALIVLSAGVNFYAAIRPVRRLNFLDLQATNAIAIFLAYLPFKLSMLFRIVVHHRRDRVPVALIAAWFGAVSLAMLAALGPLILASALSRGIDAGWVLLALGGLAATTTTLWLGARTFSGPAGLTRLRSWASGLSRLTHVALFERISHAKFFSSLHEGLGMLDTPRRVGTLVGLRLLDLAIQAARFHVAARLLDLPLTWESCVLLASTHFLIGVISPSGMVGTREAGAAGVAALLHVVDAGHAAALGVLILASEAVVNLLLAGLGILRLGPRRMFTPRTGADAPPR